MSASNSEFDTSLLTKPSQYSLLFKATKPFHPPKTNIKLNMAEEDKSAHEKKQSLLRFSVGGGGVLGGVVLLGGGLAVAGFMAAFAILKNRNCERDDQKNEADSAAATAASEKVHDGTQGLSSVLQNPTTAVHQNSCCTNHVTPTIAVTESPMDSRLLVSAHNMALEDEPLPKMDGEKEEDPSRYQQEILFSEELNKEIVESCNGILNNEEISAPAPQIKINNESGENFQLTDNIEMKKEDEPAGTKELALEEYLPKQSEEEHDDASIEEYVMDKKEVSLAGEIAPRENSATQPVEEEEEQEKESDEEEEKLTTHPVEEEEGDDEDDHDHDVYDGNQDNDDGSEEEDATEKEEESSEGTGSSSRESNVEAIWPTDVIEALSHELEVMNANKMAKTECDYINSKCENGSKNEATENAPILNKKIPLEFVMAKVETMHLPTREVCVWTLLALLLLLLLLNIHRTSPLQDLSYENSVIGPRV